MGAKVEDFDIDGVDVDDGDGHVNIEGFYDATLVTMMMLMVMMTSAVPIGDFSDNEDGRGLWRR